MNKFEQLIEYVINDEQGKARELFHEIVVEKSRNIYEEMMQDEEHSDSIDEEMGGDAADDMIDDVEVDEEGFREDEMDDVESVGVDVEMDSDEDMGDEEEELEDRVVDLEDKLDELMGEFESLMSGENADSEEMDSDMGPEMDDEEVEMDVENDEMETEDLEEAVSLKAAPKPTTSEEGGINTKSTVAANSGAKGSAAKPVHPTGTEAKGRPAPSSTDMTGTVGNTPAQSTQKPTPATKPQMSQAAGVNTKSVID